MEAGTQGTDAATTSKGLTAEGLPETEQPVAPATEVFIFNSCGNVLTDPVLHLQVYSTKHVIEAGIMAVGLATAECFSSMDKAVSEVTHEAAFKAENDSVESRATGPQREHEGDVSAPETEDTHPDVNSSLRNDPTLVPLPLEPEIGLTKTELVAERQVEITSTASTNSISIDAEVQSDPSISETAPNVQKDIPIPESDVGQHIEAADTP